MIRNIGVYASKIPFQVFGKSYWIDIFSHNLHLVYKVPRKQQLAAILLNDKVEYVEEFGHIVQVPCMPYN